MLRGELYNPADEELSEERKKARALMHAYNQTNDQQEREETIIELIGKSDGQPVFEGTFKCDYGYNVHVGRNFLRTLTLCF